LLLPTLALLSASALLAPLLALLANCLRATQPQLLHEAPDTQLQLLHRLPDTQPQLLHQLPDTQLTT
jgi:hypothetical protein